MRNKLRPYFSFTRKERKGIFLLVSICLVLIFFPYFLPEAPLSVTDITLSAGLQSLQEKEKNGGYVEAPAEPGKLFFFNPNTLDINGWKKLGLEEKLAQRIINYRNKGGQFYSPEGLKKIWGMDAEKAARLIPFVVLPDQAMQTKYVKPAITPVDINTAGVEDWKALPGIGEVLAGRIIQYRQQSGGFARFEELNSIRGVTDSNLIQIKPYLRLHEPTITKLFLNRASVYQLVQKAGIPAELASFIVKKRQEEGNYNSWSELASLPGMNKSFIEALQRAFQIE